MGRSGAVCVDRIRGSRTEAAGPATLAFAHPVHPVGHPVICASCASVNQMDDLAVIGSVLLQTVVRPGTTTIKIASRVYREFYGRILRSVAGFSVMERVHGIRQ